MSVKNVKFHLLIEGTKDPFFFSVPADKVHETIKGLTEEDYFELHIDDSTGFRVSTCDIKLFYWGPEKAESPKGPSVPLLYSEAIRTGPTTLIEANTYAP